MSKRKQATSPADSSQKKKTKAPNALPQTPKSNSTERNFNIVVYGIIESPAGTFKSNRVKSDLEKLLPAISKADSTITSKIH